MLSSRVTGRATFALAAVLAFAARAAAQHCQTDFPPDEFKARWAFGSIGSAVMASP